MSALDGVYLDLDLPQARAFQVIGFGENAVDLVCSVPSFPLQNSKMRMHSMKRMGGGTVATACALCARYGLRTRYVGRVGEDDAGEFSRRDLAKEPIDLMVEVVPEASSHFSLIIVDRTTGERTIIWDRDPSLTFGDGELKLGELLETQILLIDGNDPVASIAVAEEARADGATTVLDIDRVTAESEELLSLVHIAIPNVSFVTEFAGVGDWRKGLEAISRICSGLVGVTLGEAGAAVMWEGEIFEFQSFQVNVVDSTAAGDVFHGAFIFALLQEWSLARCMRFSNVAGALACGRLGARASIPSLEEVLVAVKGD